MFTDNLNLNLNRPVNNLILYDLMWKFLFLLLIPVYPCFAGGIEKLSFSIVTKGDTVGLIEMKKYAKGDTLVYEYLSDATVKFFGKHHVVSSKVCKYVNGRMVYSNTLTTENGKVKDKVILHWRGKYYDVEEAGDYFKQEEPVFFGTIRMFFEEPTASVKSVFAEVKLDFQELSRLSDDSYKADGGWGKGGKYYYEEGKLIKALIFSPLIDFELHRL